MNKKIYICFLLLFLMATTVTGCTKYEKDASYSTDLYGTYSCSIESSNVAYSSSTSYIFNEDSTYNHLASEIINGETTKDIDTSGTILTVESISDDIEKITLDEEVTNLLDGKTSNVIIYKYKNMIGNFYEVDVPDKKTFDLVVSTPSDENYPNEAYVFDEEGNIHSCLDYTNCADTSEEHMGIYYQYVRKNDKIYFENPLEDKSYQILFYVTDNGLFVPQWTKNK